MTPTVIPAVARSAESRDLGERILPEVPALRPRFARAPAGMTGRGHLTLTRAFAARPSASTTRIV
jgi:hypothetical protein